MPATRLDEKVARDERLRRLREMLERYRHRRRSRPYRFVPTGLARLDEALPHGGLPGGAVVEILSALDGGGAMTVALRAAIAAAEETRPVVIVDPHGDLYPPAVWQLGLAEELLLVVRSSGLREALWALDQSLRCSCVAAVIAPLDRIDAAVSRRLQLAAESSQAMGILLRPAGGRRHTFAAVQMLVEPVSHQTHGWPSASLGEGVVKRGSRASVRPGGTEPPSSSARLCRVSLTKVREGRPVEPFVISLDDETGVEPLLSVPGHGSAAGVRRRISA
ncbi:MAG: ImuA family protein [Planctomycetota bacterium]|jgi:hypothetical protein